MMNSQIPDSVSRLCGDCRTAIVMRAMYEYGGLTRLLFFLPPLPAPLPEPLLPPLPSSDLSPDVSGSDPQSDRFPLSSPRSDAQSAHDSCMSPRMSDSRKSFADVRSAADPFDDMTSSSSSSKSPSMSMSTSSSNIS